MPDHKSLIHSSAVLLGPVSALSYGCTNKNNTSRIKDFLP
ncbi:hypothetical protein ApDm4_2296 [Acetobacter pomorum]|nr:hypothetical protein ApDm4_2296 [Acetobacter pomorum]